MPVPVSILIPVKNEAGNLPRCLAALDWAAEILVGDSQSTDATCAIAEFLGAKMDHHAFPTVEVFVEKHNRYSNWEAHVAQDRFLCDSHQEIQSGRVGWRRRLRKFSQRLPFPPWLRFLYVYLWQRGFLDGREGYHFARLHGFYEHLCVVKSLELKERRGHQAGDVRPHMTPATTTLVGHTLTNLFRTDWGRPHEVLPGIHPSR